MPPSTSNENDRIEINRSFNHAASTTMKYRFLPVQFTDCTMNVLKYQQKLICVELYR